MKSTTRKSRVSKRNYSISKKTHRKGRKNTHKKRRTRVKSQRRNNRSKKSQRGGYLKSQFALLPCRRQVIAGESVGISNIDSTVEAVAGSCNDHIDMIGDAEVVLGPNYDAISGITL